MIFSFSPVAGGELLDELVRGPEAGEADLLAELGEGGVREQRHVAQQLVAHVLGTTHVSYD